MLKGAVTSNELGFGQTAAVSGDGTLLAVCSFDQANYTFNYCNVYKRGSTAVPFSTEQSVVRFPDEPTYCSQSGVLTSIWWW